LQQLKNISNETGGHELESRFCFRPAAREHHDLTSLGIRLLAYSPFRAP